MSGIRAGLGGGRELKSIANEAYEYAPCQWNVRRADAASIALFDAVFEQQQTALTGLQDYQDKNGMNGLMRIRPFIPFLS
jgi:hypothetical protein